MVTSTDVLLSHDQGAGRLVRASSRGNLANNALSPYVNYSFCATSDASSPSGPGSAQLYSFPVQRVGERAAAVQSV